MTHYTCGSTQGVEVLHEAVSIPPVFFPSSKWPNWGFTCPLWCCVAFTGDVWPYTLSLGDLCKEGRPPLRLNLFLPWGRDLLNNNPLSAFNVIICKCITFQGDHFRAKTKSQTEASGHWWEHMWALPFHRCGLCMAWSVHGGANKMNYKARKS